MKLELPYIVIGMLSAAVIFLLFQNGCSNPVPNIIVQADTVHWKNKAGDSVTSLKGAEAAFTVVKKRIADSVAQVYEVRLQDLREYLIAWTQSQSDVPEDPGTKETDYVAPQLPQCPPMIKNIRQTFRSAYYTAQVQVGDSNYLHLHAWDTITVLWKRVTEGNIFHHRHLLQLDVSTANKATSITGLMAYRVPEKTPKKFAIGLQAGYMYQSGLKPYLGIGVSYNLIRF